MINYNHNCTDINRTPILDSSTSPIWGGRFTSSTDEIMVRINTSINFDYKLYAQDILASKVHCTMLMTQGIITPEIGSTILYGLEQIMQEISTGCFTFKENLEDIHMNIEARLNDLIGPDAGFLHTGRSRNDQVATDFRLWIRSAIDTLDTTQSNLQLALLEQAEYHATTVMPGLTHLQAAQPTTLGHHLLAYVEMLGRDRSRLSDARRRMNECPLGAAALSGTSFPIDRHRTATELGFDRPCTNSLDAVSDRDFAIEFLSAIAICAVHLSRLAEEIILWTSDRFHFAKLPDTLTTGSSIMPQKRNPDAAELVRAKASRIFGALSTLFVILKGLPLAYAKDMQEDKEPVFDAVETISLSLRAMTSMISNLHVDILSMRNSCVTGHLTATDLADWLVQTTDMPFRQAHHTTGRIVRLSDEQTGLIEEIPLSSMKAVEKSITKDVYKILKIDQAVSRRTSFSGTAPSLIVTAIAKARLVFHFLKSNVF